MSIYKPSELQAFLRDLGIAPKKVLSQNFLIDGNIVRNILHTANVTPGDLILEIGPGPGALTEELLTQGAHVVAVEKDDVLGAALSRFQTSALQQEQLHIYCEDVMQFPIEETLRKLLRPGEKAKVIANLPYHLTSLIIEKLIQMNDLFSSLTLMVQEEVARRFIAQPKTKDYSSFTLFLNTYAHVRYAFRVSKSCFFPVPKVDSAIVNFELKQPAADIVWEDFFKLTRAAFEKRRKMMRVSLKEMFSSEKVAAALKEIGCSEQARPEELSQEQFLRLFSLLRTEAT